jgi:hypothetical protein
MKGSEKFISVQMASMYSPIDTHSCVNSEPQFSTLAPTLPKTIRVRSFRVGFIWVTNFMRQTSAS